MNTETHQIANQLKDSYEGNPWFGRSVKSLLAEVTESHVFERPNNQHSILELLWHMITWREFTIASLRNDNKKSPVYFEENDWRVLDHDDKALWEKGLKKLDLGSFQLFNFQACTTSKINLLLCQRLV